MHEVLSGYNAQEVKDVYEGGVDRQEGSPNGCFYFEANVW